MRTLKTITYNILLDPTTRKMLEELGAANDVSCAQILRESIRWRFAMQIAGAPTCANGRPCFVPHLHAMPPNTAASATLNPTHDHPEDRRHAV